MLKPRYYYSEPMKVGRVLAALDDNNEVIGLLSNNPDVEYTAPRVTICGIWDDEKNTMSFGVARCSWKDTFRRDIGRKLAYNRAMTDPCITFSLDGLRVADAFMETATRLEEVVFDATFPIKLDKSMINV